MSNRTTWFAALMAGLLAVTAAACPGTAADPPRRVLLLAQSPDGHPAATHEYVAGLRILEHLLRRQPGLEPRLLVADSPWKDGPELLDGADAAVLFLAEGAKWVGADADRLAAFRRLAERKGGLATLHWGMGTKTAEPIPAFVELFGGCHGGPDRKYAVVETEVRPARPSHPALTKVAPFRSRDEFYYALKFAREPAPTPLWTVEIDAATHPVAWAWDRPDGGRSFGFSGLHFHDNWRLEEYRRLVVQGVLWTCRCAIPADGANVDIPAELLRLSPPAP